MSKESRRAARLARESRRAGRPDRRRAGRRRRADEAPGGGPSGARRRPDRAAGRRSGVGARAGRRDRVRPSPADLPRALPDLRSSPSRPSRSWRSRSAFVFIGATAAGLRLREIFSPSPTPAGRAGLEHPARLRRGGHGPQPQRQPSTDTTCTARRHPATTTTRPGLGPIQPRRVQAGRQGRPAELDPQPRARRARRPLSAATRRARRPSGPAGLQDFFATFPPSPICKIPAADALAGDRPRSTTCRTRSPRIVWDRVFYLDTWDPALVLRFYNDGVGAARR